MRQGRSACLVVARGGCADERRRAVHIASVDVGCGGQQDVRELKAAERCLQRQPIVREYSSVGLAVRDALRLWTDRMPADAPQPSDRTVRQTVATGGGTQPSAALFLRKASRN